MNNKFFLAGIFFLLGLGLIAQEPIKHEKKLYTDSTGNLFVNKELPIYLRLAVSPDDNAKSVLLKSEETKEYANPLYLDTEGYNSIRTPSAVDKKTMQTVYPLRDVVFEVYADSKPPVTKINYGNVKLFTKKGKLYSNNNTEITLTSKDQTSGVENIYYSLDKSPFSPYKTPIKLDQQKEYVFKYYAVDNVGNAEAVQTVTLVIDGTKPVTKLDVKGDKYNNVLSGRSFLMLHSTDSTGVAKIYYKIDDAPEKVYTSPLACAYISQGEHVITYYSVDDVNNMEPVNKFEFYVDKTPPTIVDEIMGNSYMAAGQEYSSGRTQLKLTAFDNKAGIKEIFYSINGGEFKLYQQPVTLSAVSGNLSVKTYGIDNVNNKTESTQQTSSKKIPYIDLTGPAINYSFSGPAYKSSGNTFISKETKISLSGNDPEAGMNRLEYSLDGANPQTYVSPFSIENEGEHKIKFYGYDNVENSNFKEFQVVVDNTGPEIFHRFSSSSKGSKTVSNQNLELYPPQTVLFLSATDTKCGFDKLFFSINGKPLKLYTDQIKYFEKTEKQSVTINALDKLGNKTEKTIDFSIEN